MKRFLIPLILTVHALCVLLFTHFCKDADNPGYWGLIYYLSDPLFFGLFAISFKMAYVDDSLNENLITVWGFMNVGRFIAYALNGMGYIERTYNLQILLFAIVLGTFIILISGLRHGTFKN